MKRRSSNRKIQGGGRTWGVRRRVTCTVLPFLVLQAVTSNSSMAQEVEGLQLEGLQEAVDFYHENATSDLPRILDATYRFEAIAARYEENEDIADRWLAPYWTALGYSQLVLFSGDDRGKSYVQLAQHYYDIAWELRPEGDSTIEADFHALNALIQPFWAQAYPDQANQRYADQGRFLGLAAAADPDNPMIFMNRAIGLLQDPATRDEAYVNVDRAIELYEPRMGTVRPNWGREFLDVWTGRFPKDTP